MFIKSRRIRLLARPVLFLILAPLCFMLISCQQSEGRGGTGSISGTLSELTFNDDFSRLLQERPAVEQEVYIVYGDEMGVGDRVRTDAGGQFIFEFLYPGDYQVFYMSEDSTALYDGDLEKTTEVRLDRDEDYDLGIMEKFRTLDFDDGSATIKGLVMETDYIEISWPDLIAEDRYPALEQEVYLTYGSHVFYDERIRTQHDGTFAFTGLIPGDYLVFVYSENVTDGSGDKIPITIELSIDDPDQVYDMGSIEIQKF